MNTKKSLMFSLALLGLIGFAEVSPNRSSGSSVSSPQTEGANVALLIGINQYPNLPPNKQLRGCVNDVLLVQKLLIERFKFKPENIKTLLNQEATRMNIQKQFEEFLIKNADPKGQAVFYFSGHGGKMTDLNSDEMDKFDETLLTYDSRDQAGKIKDIEDETLGQWLAALTTKCKNATVILDCCHSGSGTRGGPDPTEARARFADTLFLSLPKTIGPAKNKGPSGFLPPNPHYVLIAGSRDNELSHESAGYGALTSALNEVLRNNENMTYREMMYKVSAMVTGQYPQHPQVEGGRTDAKVFGNLGKVENFLTVVKKDGKQVLLSGGTAHNVTEGSVYALYKPGTTNRADSARYFGQAKVTKVAAFTAWAEIQREKANIIPNAAAFEISHHYGAQQLPVRLAIKNDPQLLAQIQKTLADYKAREDLVKVVTDTQKYAVKIQLSPDKKSLFFMGPERRILKTIYRDTLNVDKHLPEILTKMARWRNLFDLQNRQSKLKVSVRLQRWGSFVIEDNKAVPINPLKMMDAEGGERFLYDQDIINVTLKNLSQKQVHFYLLDLGTDGSVTYLYPGKNTEDSPISPGDSVVTFPFRASLPEGLDALKLIVTTVPTDFSVLAQAGYLPATTRATSKSGIDSPLGRLLNLAYGGTRNFTGLDPTPIDDWATDMVAVLIKPKP